MSGQLTPARRRALELCRDAESIRAPQADHFVLFWLVAQGFVSKVRSDRAPRYSITAAGRSLLEDK